MSHVIWTQWDDLVAPDGLTLLNPSNAPLDSDAIKEVTFYVPPYMSGAVGLEPVDRMPNLQVLQMPNAGYDDAIAFAREGMRICNARGVHDISTAELALGLTIASLREIDDFVRAQATGSWIAGTRPSLAYKKVGLVGYGSIGQTIGRMLEPFQVELLAFTRSGRNGTLPISELDSHLPQLDVVILILPATAESTGLMNAPRLSLMKDGALLVNVARGVIVDTDALVAELATGRISAALDVTDPEPLPADHPLWSSPGVIISPHVGGNSSAFPSGMRALLRRQFDHLAKGETLENVVVDGLEGVA